MGDYHVHLHPHGPYEGIGPPPGQYPIDHIEAFTWRLQKPQRVQRRSPSQNTSMRCIESKDVLGPWWTNDPRTDLAAATSAYVRSERVLSLERYVQAVVDAKDRGLPVLLGLEVDYFPEVADDVAAFLAPFPFDILIASTHWIGAWGRRPR